MNKPFITKFLTFDNRDSWKFANLSVFVMESGSSVLNDESRGRDSWIDDEKGALAEHDQQGHQNEAHAAHLKSQIKYQAKRKCYDNP